jgi:uncharacterized protein (DUF2336 family)
MESRIAARALSGGDLTDPLPDAAGVSDNPGRDQRGPEGVSETTQDLNQLLRLALDQTIAGRNALAETISDLFAERAERLSDRERALMSGILGKLLTDCEMAVRSRLAERLAKLSDPPRELLRSLANDSIEVARPLLTDCGLLKDEDLIGVIRRRTQEHQLAIAARRRLSETVSEALVATGDGDVIRTLLDNQDARISEATRAYIAAQARRVDAYQEPRIARNELEPSLAARLYHWVSAALRHYILTNHALGTPELGAPELDGHLREVAETLSGDPETHGPAVQGRPESTHLASALAAQGELSPPFLIEVLRQGEIALFESLLAAWSGVDGGRVQRMLYDGLGEGLAIACRALAMDKGDFATIYVLSRGGRGGGNQEPQVSRILELFEEIGEVPARQLLEAWRQGGDYLAAVECVEAELREAPEG